jgi:hypothetical protein
MTVRSVVMKVVCGTVCVKVVETKTVLMLVNVLTLVVPDTAPC